MSTHTIYYKDGVKMMRPVLTREEYLKLRNGGFQVSNVARIRQGDEALKSSLVQMNYSCLPNADGTLRGSKRMTTSVAMDVDHIAPEQMAATAERILSKKAELGLQMLERSARGQGYHLVFRRRQELSQEENLQWAADLLGVEYDKGAKDITRVFFTTTGSADDLLFLDDAIFEETPSNSPCVGGEHKPVTAPKQGETEGVLPFPTDYHGIPFADILRKYWELNNGGFEYLRTLVCVARPGHPLLRRFPLGREAAEDTQRPAVEVRGHADATESGARRAKVHSGTDPTVQVHSGTDPFVFDAAEVARTDQAADVADARGLPGGGGPRRVPAAGYAPVRRTLPLYGQR